MHIGSVAIPLGQRKILAAICVLTTGFGWSRGKGSRPEEPLNIDLERCTLGGVQVDGAVEEFVQIWGEPEKHNHASSEPKRERVLVYSKYALNISTKDGRMTVFGVTLSERKERGVEVAQFKGRKGEEHQRAFLESVFGKPGYQESFGKITRYVYRGDSCCLMFDFTDTVDGAFSVAGYSYNVSKDDDGVDPHLVEICIDHSKKE